MHIFLNLNIFLIAGMINKFRFRSEDIYIYTQQYVKLWHWDSEIHISSPKSGIGL